MGSIPARSAITKYRMLPLVATERYWFLVTLIYSSTTAAEESLCVISADVFFEFSRVMMRSS